MELKRFQLEVIDDLRAYLDALAETGDPARAYNLHWERKGERVGIREGDIPPYSRSALTAPDVCLKVPTGGGKTLLAASAVGPIFDAMPADMRLVIWLVPSTAILSQTVDALKTEGHPYRRQLERSFGRGVRVYGAEDLLAGAQLSPAAMSDQLTVCVMCYASLRANSQDRLRMYRENGGLIAFRDLLRGSDGVGDELSLMRLFNALSPLVILDESHNATSNLTRKMLADLNPRFVLELTATPKESSPISIVTAARLKDEHMVKIPLIVYERGGVDDALYYAWNLRNDLERRAEAECAVAGRYMRPIMLIQAEPRRGSESVTYEAVKAKMMSALGIPEEQIAIKTSDHPGPSVREIMSRDSRVRYIITVNAIREGWDCPFAYILVSISPQSSRTSVEQIVGRVMRMPDTTPFADPYLNVCYVFATSRQFNDTLRSVAEGLTIAGFSRRDYRAARMDNLDRFVEGTDDDAEPEDGGITPEEIGRIRIVPPAGAGPSEDGAVPELGPVERKRMLDELREGIERESPPDMAGETPLEGFEMADRRAVMRERFRESADSTAIPYILMEVASGLETYPARVTPDSLMADFRLAGMDANVMFGSVRGNIVGMDVSREGRGETLERFNLTEAQRESFQRMVTGDGMDRSGLVTALFDILNRSRRFDAISSRDLRAYVGRVVEAAGDDGLEAIIRDPASAAENIARRILDHMEAYRQERFFELKDSGRLFADTSAKGGAYRFERKREIGRAAGDGMPFERSLYDKVPAGMNDFELRVINQVDGLENIVWWHRIDERRRGEEFCLSGFINHYPDFVALTRGGRVVLIETKGPQNENADSARKVRLGRAWEAIAGQSRYRYFMVFDSSESPIEGSITLNQLIDYLRKLRSHRRARPAGPRPPSLRI